MSVYACVHVCWYIYIDGLRDGKSISAFLSVHPIVCILFRECNKAYAVTYLSHEYEVSVSTTIANYPIMGAAVTSERVLRDG